MKPKLAYNNTATAELTAEDRERAFEKCTVEMLSVTESIAEKKGEFETLAFTPGDEADHSSVFESRQITLAQLNRLSVRYEQLANALKRGVHDIGSCLCCQDDVAPQRLDNNPAVENCISCEELREPMQNKFASPHAMNL